MDALIRDIWHDLREKRLWPVALALLVGLVAVPLVLLKSPEPPPPAAPAAGAAGGESPELATMAALGIESSGGPGGRGSSLDSFEPRNPFKPAASVLASGEDELEPIAQVADSASAEPVESSPEASGSSSEDFGSASLGSSGGSDGGSPSLAPATPAPVGGGGGQGGGGSAPDPKPKPAPAPDPKSAPNDGAEDPEPKRMTYVVDVSFAGPERRRVIRGLPRLAALPHASVPLVIFLGVDDSGGEALFLIDAKLHAQEGEGTCRPSPEQCATLALEVREHRTFVDDQGREYLLQLDRIRAVDVKRAIRSRRAIDARAAREERSAPQRFLPVLVDIFTGG